MHSGFLRHSLNDSTENAQSGNGQSLPMTNPGTINPRTNKLKTTSPRTTNPRTTNPRTDKTFERPILERILEIAHTRMAGQGLLGWTITDNFLKASTACCF